MTATGAKIYTDHVRKNIMRHVKLELEAVNDAAATDIRGPTVGGLLPYCRRRCPKLEERET